jgi:hypothetical protein
MTRMSVDAWPLLDTYALEPYIAVTGHGRAFEGEELRSGLHSLAENFDIVAVPDSGTYVKRPAIAEDGTAYDTP